MTTTSPRCSATATRSASNGKGNITSAIGNDNKAKSMGDNKVTTALGNAKKAVNGFNNG